MDVTAPGYASNKQSHLRRLHRIEGQVRGLQRMVTEDTYCIDVRPRFPPPSELWRLWRWSFSKNTWTTASPMRSKAVARRRTSRSRRLPRRSRASSVRDAARLSRAQRRRSPSQQMKP